MLIYRKAVMDPPYQSIHSHSLALDPTTRRMPAKKS
jgi:hypothetical protein